MDSAVDLVRSVVQRKISMSSSGSKQHAVTHAIISERMRTNVAVIATTMAASSSASFARLSEWQKTLI